MAETPTHLWAKRFINACLVLNVHPLGVLEACKDLVVDYEDAVDLVKAQMWIKRHELPYCVSPPDSLRLDKLTGSTEAAK